MLVSLTVGKVDAGVAVLLTEDKRLVHPYNVPYEERRLTSPQIEFPSILLPPSITSGSIVDITVAQNEDAERKSLAAFETLQSQILNTYGLQSPSTPILRLRNATQTSLVLEWDPIELATSKLRSLALYRNGSKAGNIPRPFDMLSTKISGLAVDTEYSFYLVLRTSGGTYTSNNLTVKTHDMNNLTGITVTPGVMAGQLRESLESAIDRIGAKIVDTVRIDTTHFVCTEGRGRDWERANEMNIPVVRPEWVEGCEREGKLIGVRGYYLDANPKHRQIGSNPSLSTMQQPSQGNRDATMSPASQAAAATAGQVEMPDRTNPKSPDAESSVDGEPGPEVAPSPPPKHDEPQDAADQGEEEEDDESEGERGLERGAERANTDESAEESDEEEVPNEKELEARGDRPGGSGAMEDVEL